MAGHFLLTGGAGFIGSHLAEALVKSGRRVVVLDKLTYAGNRENLHNIDVDLVVGDISDTTLVQRLCEEAECVINTAAESHVTRSLSNANPFIQTNVEGARTVVEAAAKAGVPHCIHFSTDEVFGPSNRGQKFVINSPHKPSNAYAASKASGEAFIQSVCIREKYPCTIVRMTNNYGERQHIEKAIPSWIAHATAKKPIPIHGQGKAERDWLHVSDFCQGILQLIEQADPGEIHHFAGGCSRSNRSVVDRIAETCGGVEIKEGPERPGQDMRYLLEDSNTRKRLNWQPEVPFEQGLDSLVVASLKALQK